MRTLFSSESVTAGHPDKLCDQISDAILDELLTHDPMSRVACEAIASTGIVLIMGEITTTAQVDYCGIARKVITDIGYNSSEQCFDGNSCAILTSIHSQSPDIAMGVDCAIEGREKNQKNTGAGDQGIMFGYACNDTPEMMPMTVVLAHRLTRKLDEIRKSGELPWLRPDGKSQVTVAYENGRPVAITTVVLSAQHSESVSQEQIKNELMTHVIRAVLPERLLTPDTRYLINPTGRFVLGGPAGDSGLTGRKIIVDTYGGFAPHGGGCFSGKDPTKVDRSGSYAARYIAKNVVAAGLASRCTVHVAYSIGVAEPVGLYVNTDGTGAVPDDRLADAVRRVFDLRPDAIIERLRLRRPIYRPTASYGHFGRTDLDLPWEKDDAADALKRALKAG